MPVSSAFAKPTKLWRRATSVSRFGSLLALTVASNFLIAALGVISGGGLARLLGPAGRGEIAAIQSWPLFLSLLAHLGVQEALAYYSARHPHEAGRWLTTATLLILLPNLLAVVVGYYLMPTLLAAQSAEVVRASRVYLLYLPLVAITGLPGFALRGRNDLVAWNLHRTLPGLLWMGIVVAGLIGGGATPTAITSQYLVGFAVVSGLSAAFLVWKRLPSSFRPAAAMLKPLIGYGLPALLSSIPSLVNARLDQILMVGFVDSRVLGLYVAGVAWGGAGSLFVTALAATLLPRVAGIEDAAERGRVLAQVTRLGTTLSVLVAAAVLPITPAMMPLIFGRSFSSGIPAAMVLVPASALSAFNLLLGSGAMSLGRPRYVLLAESAGCVATALLLWLLLPRYGAVGAAWASLLSYGVTSLVLLTALTRLTQLKLADLLLPTRADFEVVVRRLRHTRFASKAA